METSTEEGGNLKGGHPPAQKVGGVRIVTHKGKDGTVDKPESSSPPKQTQEDKEEFGEDKPVKPPNSVVVSGAKASEGDAFPKEAVKSFHEKPQPTHEKGASQKPKVIQQPKK